MICKHILLTKFLNEPKLIIFAHSEIFSNKSMYHQQFN